MTDDEVVAAVAALAAKRHEEDPSADIVAHSELLARAAARGDAGGELAHEILTLHAPNTRGGAYHHDPLCDGCALHSAGRFWSECSTTALVIGWLQ